MIKQQCAAQMYFFFPFGLRGFQNVSFFVILPLQGLLTGEIVQKPLPDGRSLSRRIFVTLINALDAQLDRPQSSSIPSGSPVRAGADGDRIGVTNGTLASTRFPSRPQQNYFQRLIVALPHTLRGTLGK